MDDSDARSTKEELVVGELEGTSGGLEGMTPENEGPTKTRVGNDPINQSLLPKRHEK